MTGCGPCSDLPAAHCGGEGAGLIPAPGASQPAPASRLFHPRDTLPTCGLGVQGDCRGPRYVGAGLWPGVRKQGEGVAVRPPGLGYDMEEVPARGSELGGRGGSGGPTSAWPQPPVSFRTTAPGGHVLVASQWLAEPEVLGQKDSPSVSLAPCSGHCPHTDTPQLPGPASAP